MGNIPANIFLSFLYYFINRTFCIASFPHRLLSFIRRDALSAKPVERQDADNGLLYNVITKEKKRGTACIEWQFLFLLAFFLLLFPIRKKYLIFVRPIKTKA